MYFYVGGLAGRVGRRRPAGRAARERRSRAAPGRIALAGSRGQPGAADLRPRRPARFLHMLRMFKVTSPMSVGSWILAGFGDAPRRRRRACADRAGAADGRVAQVAAALLGLPLASYTGALVANTAVPAWHEARGRAAVPVRGRRGGERGRGADRALTRGGGAGARAGWRSAARSPSSAIAAADERRLARRRRRRLPTAVAAPHGPPPASPPPARGSSPSRRSLEARRDRRAERCSARERSPSAGRSSGPAAAPPPGRKTPSARSALASTAALLVHRRQAARRAESRLPGMASRGTCDRQADGQRSGQIRTRRMATCAMTRDRWSCSDPGRSCREVAAPYARRERGSPAPRDVEGDRAGYSHDRDHEDEEDCHSAFHDRRLPGLHLRKPITSCVLGPPLGCPATARRVGTRARPHQDDEHNPRWPATAGAAREERGAVRSPTVERGALWRRCLGCDAGRSTHVGRLHVVRPAIDLTVSPRADRSASCSACAIDRMYGLVPGVAGERPARGWAAAHRMGMGLRRRRTPTALAGRPRRGRPLTLRAAGRASGL